MVKPYIGLLVKKNARKMKERQFVFFPFCSCMLERKFEGFLAFYYIMNLVKFAIQKMVC